MRIYVTYFLSTNRNQRWKKPSLLIEYKNSIINIKSISHFLGGFWDDSSNKQAVQKPSSVIKSNSTNSVHVSAKPQQKQQPSQQQQPSKTKAKKEETNKMNHNNNNNGPLDEFTNWCYKSLSNISSNVDSKYNNKIFIFYTKNRKVG